MKKVLQSVADEAGKKGVNKAIDLVVDRFINPKLDKILNAPKDVFVIRDLFKEYLNKKYEKDKYMNTIVFRQETKTIDDLYIPLTIMQTGKRNNIVLNENMKNIFYEPNRMLIIDTAGTGKSTLVKFLSLLCIKSEWGIPFVVELRRIEQEQSIIDYIKKDIKLNNGEINDADIMDLIRRGDFIFFFDGYDEVLQENKAYVTKQIREFVTSASENNFVLTSREDDCLSEFGDFTKFHIQPLKKDEAYALIRKYDEYGTISENLIDEIEKNQNYKALEEFLGNPLMVSLLYLTFRYKGVLQYKKNIFYRQVFDALYDMHDTIKGFGAIHVKKSALDIEDFRRVLCAIGFISVKTGKVEFEKEQIIEIINKAISVFPEISADANNYLDDILHAVPLFVEEGINYKWAHKSFAEYFAAVFICKECKEYESKVLKEILETENNKRFYNMLDFCYDIDYKAVLENIVYPVLTEYISFYDKEKKEKGNLEFWEEKIFHKFISCIYLIKIDEKPRPKDREIFRDFFTAVNMLAKENIFNFSYINSLSKSENIVMITQRNYADTVIRLLFVKGMDLFKEVKVKSFSMKFLKNINKIGVYEIFERDKNESWMKKNEDYIISTISHAASDYNSHILDIDKCREKIKEIEVEKEKITDDFFALS